MDVHIHDSVHIYPVPIVNDLLFGDMRIMRNISIFGRMNNWDAGWYKKYCYGWVCVI
jgi:hypothetical protein